MKCTNGQTLYTNEKTTDSDYDGLTDNEEVDMYTDLEYKGAPSYIQNNSPYKYVFKMISDPMKEDTDGDGIKDNKDKRISIADYLEDYVCLSKDNSPNNSIYIQVEKNTITITAHVYFDAYYDLLFPGTKITYKDLIVKGIEENWSGMYIGTEYDFIDGMPINVVTNVISYDRDHRCDMNQLCLYYMVYVKDIGCYYKPSAENILPSEELWRVTNPMGNIHISPSKGDTQNDYECVAAHEFGHALGLNDLYPKANGFDAHKDDEILCKSGELSKNQIMWTNHNVSLNDIEMVIQAFSENKWQQYYNSKKYKQSKAIRTKFKLVNNDKVKYEN